MALLDRFKDWMLFILLLSGIIICHSFASTVQAQISLNKKNEISISIERLRGGWEPVDFFDGGTVGLSYNRLIIPYVLMHSKLSFSRLFLSDSGGGSYLAELHHDNMLVTDVGLEVIPVSTKYFQLRVGFSGSLQYRQTSSGMDSEGKSGIQSRGRVYFFNYSSLYKGYKFELKTPLVITESFFLSPVASIRSYPEGEYKIPRSFEFGIQSSFRF